MQRCRNQNGCQFITSFFDDARKLFILSGLENSSKNTYCFIINIIKVNTEYVKNQKYHVYKRIEKVYNNPHPGSGVV